MAQSAMGRARLSCLPCRKRKSKCNEQMPCSSCVLRNTCDSCHLPDAFSSPKLVAPPTSTPHSHSSFSLDHRHTQKKRRLSFDAAQHTSSAPLEEIFNIRRGLARLEDMVKSESFQVSSQATNYGASSTSQSIILPNRLDNIDEVLAILPCQNDCEVLFEYVLQEADWMVTSIGVQWLQPIWDRFVFGGRVTPTECTLLVAVLALAALLLHEGHHIYYQTTAPLGPLQTTLIDYVFERIPSSSLPKLNADKASSSNHDTLNQFLVLAITFDYLRVSGTRKQQSWEQVREYLYQMVHSTPILSDSNLFWEGLDELETEYARRMVWHFVLCERWFGLYDLQITTSPFRKADIVIKEPRWVCTSLSAPFHATPSSYGRDVPVKFRASTKSVPRLFRVKEQHEVDQVAVFARLFMELSVHVLAASIYNSSIDSWRKQRRKIGLGEGQIDHQREALLHQSVAICSDVRDWQDSIKSFCAEPDTLNQNDYFACRKASQAAIIHVGRRQLLNVVLGAWVTEESIMEVGSSLMAQQQREAFSNAREAVQTIEVTRTLLSCGKVLQIPWVTLAFFTAATTLAIPLLAAGRLREKDSTGNVKEDCPRVFRLDQLHKIDNSRTSYSHAKDTPTPRPSSPASSFLPTLGSKTNTPVYSISTSIEAPSLPTSILSMEEMRTLAPDILRILELMPPYKSTLLSNEARQRLVMLVDTYGISHSSSILLPQEQSTVNDDLDNSTLRIDSSAAILSATESNSFSILDSLIALDDLWWEQLLSSDAEAETHVNSTAT